MSASHFRELDVWQLSMELTRRVYELTARFPREERYGLASQLQRAAVSIPSNIAEGNGRRSTRDYARFVAISCGSVAELQTQLQLASDLGLASEDAVAPILETSEAVGRMLYRLHQSLHARLESRSPVPGPRSRISEPLEDYA
ncbi:four helix bundle protein [Luteimonas sp. 8-5]|uniref:four helix bundle protein n=1 Tax=Luteimonas sp. 8-5 TaxID=3039387 RepID=UPI00243654DD|nr:four helix bundle protein [Luteimonas sp. 8-5]MDG6347977.1 four helix bundle protein [Luteimonas sp. 8-5]